MAYLWLLTGTPGVGKSTVVAKVILRLRSRGVIVGGCLTAEKRVRGERVGFVIRDLTNGGEGELASLTGSLGPRVGKYRVNLVDLERVAARALNDAASTSELVVIDEVGPMELVSPDFRRRVMACLESGKPVLAVVHERMQDDVLEELKKRATSITSVTVLNRDGLPDVFTDEISAALGLPKSS